MFLSLALKFDRTGRSTVIWYSQIIFIYILDIGYFKAYVDWTEIAGATLIIGANLCVIIYKFLRPPTKEA